MDIHFNSYKIRYAILNQFMKPIRDSQKIHSVDIYINLDDIFHTLHKPLIDREFQACGKNAGRQLVSNVFNIIGHYRNWALKEKLNPKIYAYYTSANTQFRNNVHVTDYRKHFFEINNPHNGKFYFINDAILKAMPIFHAIAKYIDGCYIIDTRHLEPSIFPYYMMQRDDIPSDPFKWNLVVSRDTYDVQYCYQNRCSLISPKGDYSLLVTRKNMWSYVAQRDGMRDVPEYHWTHELYTIAKSIIGDRYRNIPRLRSVGWKTLFKAMECVQNESDDKEIVLLQRDKLLELMTNKRITVEVANQNISAVSLEIQVGSMLATDSAMINTQFEDMMDYPTLAHINNDLFHEFPLNLTFLCNQLQNNSMKW